MRSPHKEILFFLLLLLLPNPTATQVFSGPLLRGVSVGTPLPKHTSLMGDAVLENNFLSFQKDKRKHKNSAGKRLNVDATF